MARGNGSTGSYDGEIIETLYLSPDEILVHPVVEEMEKAGIPAQPKKRDIKALSDSINESIQLQPIPVIGYDGRYYRIAGLSRKLAAEMIGISIRCEVLRVDFHDEDLVMKLHFDENLRRRHLTETDKKTLGEKYKKFVSRRTMARINLADSIHPELQELVKKGVLGVESDEDKIRIFSHMPQEAQELLARCIKPIKSTEVQTEVEEVIPQEILDEIKRLQEENRKVSKDLLNYKKTLKDKQKEESKLLESLGNLEKRLQELKKGSKEGEYAKKILELESLLTTRENQLEARKDEIKELKVETGRLIQEIKSKNRQMYDEVAKYKDRIDIAMHKEAAILRREVSNFLKKVNEDAKHLIALLRALEYNSLGTKGTVVQAVNELEAKLPEITKSLIKTMRDIAIAKDKEFQQRPESKVLDYLGDKRETKKKHRVSCGGAR